MLAFRDATNARFDAVDARFDGIDDQLHSMKTDIGHLRGDVLEGRYIDHIRPWFGKWLRPVELVFVDDLILVEDALEAGRISQAEVDDLREADMLVKGRSRANSGFPDGEVILVVEVSTVIETKDVKRAVRRAESWRAPVTPLSRSAAATRLSPLLKKRQPPTASSWISGACVKGPPSA